ncbi:TPA: hypothetical protein QHU55_002556 [Klebsiella aerogenes]|nr:hypothetical protein [Klebsiella aerogenes]
MKIEKAIFGQVGQGHGLRKCSSNYDFFRKISQRLDLPDVIPSGVNFSPYVSGFSFENKYVLSRSFIDGKASRSGMITVYSLAFNIGEISNINNLEALFQLLPMELCNEDVFINASCEYTEVSSELNSVLSDNIIKLLTEKKDGPIVYVGLDGFEELVSSIWINLWPGMRRDFSFRLSVSPKDCIEPIIPSLVCIPTSLRSRWSKHKVINELETVTSTCPVIIAFKEGYQAFKNLCESFDIEINKPSMLWLLVEAKKHFEKKQPTFNELIILIRFIEVLSPDDFKGIDQKLTLKCNLVNVIKHASASDLLKLRNFSGTGFGDITDVWNAVTKKLCSESYLVQDDVFFIEIINNLYSETNSLIEWRTSVEAGLIGALSILNESLYSAIWRWFNINIETTFQLLIASNINHDAESMLAAHVQKNLSQPEVECLLKHFSSKRLLVLHGTVLGLYLPTEVAFKMQVGIDTNPNNTSGLAALASKVDPKHLLSSCINLNDNRLNDIVIRMAVDNPSILETVSEDSKMSLFIWTRALSLNHELWDIPSGSKRILHFLLDEYLYHGNTEHIELLRLLSQSPLSDLCDYPKFNEIYNLFDEVCRANYLKSTARGWYERALRCEYMPLGNVLEDAVYRLNDLSVSLRNNSLKHTEGIVGIFARVSLFSENDFKTWLEYWFSHQVNQDDLVCRLIGETIVERKWVQVSKLVFEREKMRCVKSSHILMHCKSILPLFDRLYLGEYTYEEKWKALMELLIELYYVGPDDNNIWARSGGSAWDIWSMGSGYERWKRAIERIKNGAKPRPMELLNEVAIDFPSNQKVNVLKKIFEEG